MCLGIPMQVIESGDGLTICEVDGQRRRIDTLLVGPQPPGTWLLTFLDTAREVISTEQAEQTRAALRALDLAMQGQAEDVAASIDHLFADLVDREPQLPDFLRAPATIPTTGD